MSVKIERHKDVSIITKSLSGWLLFNIKWAFFQLFHGENKLHFN